MINNNAVILTLFSGVLIASSSLLNMFLREQEKVYLITAHTQRTAIWLAIVAVIVQLGASK